MNGYGSSEEHQPVTWFRGHAIYAAHFVVLAFIGSMLATTLLMLLKITQPLAWLTFSNQDVLRGQVWRIFTYGLVNQPSLPFAIDMLMLVWFGRELEKFLGRRTFFFLFAGIYLVTPLLFVAIGIWRPAMQMSLVGEFGSSFAIFVAFATLYPNVMLLFNLLAKWVAMILVGIFTLIDLSGRNWIELLALWATVSFAYAFVRHHQGLLSFPTFARLAPKPSLRVLPDLPAKNVPALRTAKTDSMVEMDALLDKIAQSGLSSLTSKERAKLDKAREELLRSKK